VAGNLDGVVLVGGGKMKRQVGVEKVLLELNARLLLLVSRDADIELERCSPHDDVDETQNRGKPNSNNRGA
jgi:hypothetical protein